MSPFTLGHSGCSGSAFYSLRFLRVFKPEISLLFHFTLWRRPRSSPARPPIWQGSWSLLLPGGGCVDNSCPPIVDRLGLDPGYLAIFRYPILWPMTPTMAVVSAVWRTLTWEVRWCGLKDTDMSGQVVRSMTPTLAVGCAASHFLPPIFYQVTRGRSHTLFPSPQNMSWWLLRVGIDARYESRMSKLRYQWC